MFVAFLMSNVHTGKYKCAERERCGDEEGGGGGGAAGSTGNLAAWATRSPMRAFICQQMNSVHRGIRPQSAAHPFLHSSAYRAAEKEKKKEWPPRRRRRAVCEAASRSHEVVTSASANDRDNRNQREHQLQNRCRRNVAGTRCLKALEHGRAVVARWVPGASSGCIARARVASARSSRAQNNRKRTPGLQRNA